MAVGQGNLGEQILRRFARNGAQVRIIVQDDACPACRVHLGRVYSPDRAPLLPLTGCTSGYCRCRYEAVDPASGLPVSELVRRGAQLVKSRLKRGAMTALRRAAALDELYEPAWLWLSAVVDDTAKIDCLKTVLEINPQNAWARKKLRLVQRKLGLVSPARGTAPLVDIPMDVLQIRIERQVIVEQWQAFMEVVGQVAPHIAYEQATAFLRSLDRANIQAIDKLLTINALRDEMEQQWRELDVVGHTLGQAIRDFAYRTDYHADERRMKEVFQKLFDELLARRKAMKKQVLLYGGRIAIPSP